MWQCWFIAKCTSALFWFQISAIEAVIAWVDKNLKEAGSLSENWAIVQEYNELLREQRIVEEPHISDLARFKHVISEKKRQSDIAILDSFNIAWYEEMRVLLQQMLKEQSCQSSHLDDRTSRLLHRASEFGMLDAALEKIKAPQDEYSEALIALKDAETTLRYAKYVYSEASVRVFEDLSKLPRESYEEVSTLRLLHVASDALIRQQQMHGRYVDSLAALRRMAWRTQNKCRQSEETFAAAHDAIRKEIEQHLTRKGTLRTFCVSEEVAGKTVGLTPNPFQIKYV